MHTTVTNIFYYRAALFLTLIPLDQQMLLHQTHHRTYDNDRMAMLRVMMV
jgi:hypothetical protein